MKSFDFNKEILAIKQNCIHAIIEILNKKGTVQDISRVTTFNEEDEVPDISIWEEHGGISIGTCGRLKSVTTFSPNDIGITVNVDSINNSDSVNLLASYLCADEIVEVYNALVSHYGK